MSEVAAPPPLAGFGLPDENHNVKIIVGTGVTTLFALIIACVRLWVRSTIVRQLGGDDYWILAAMVLSIIGFAIIIPEMQYGGGRHMFYIITRTDLGPSALVLALKLNFVTQFTYVFALSFVKISIGLFLLRLAPTGYYRKIIWSVIGFVVFYTVGGSGALLAQCKPFAANFDRTIPGSSCYAPTTLRALAFTNSSLGIFTDLAFALLPIPLLWTLKINKKTKISVLGILSLGLFAASASVVKIYYLTGYGKFGDFLWDATPLTIWSATEVNVAIIAASIPSLKPLFKSLLGSTYGKSLYGKNPSNTRGYAHQLSGRENDQSNGSKLRNIGVRGEAFEMHNTGNAAARSGNRERDKHGLNISEESILPLQSNVPDERKGIMKTTQIFVKSAPMESEKPRSVEDRV